MAVQISGNDITVPRDGTFSRNVSIAGTLTYEDVTNVDSIGLVTARNGIEVGASPGVAASISVDGNMIISGISTFGDDITFTGATSGRDVVFDTSLNQIRAQDNAKLCAGSSSDLEIYHNATNSYIDNYTGHIYVRNNLSTDNGGNIYLQAKSGEDGIIVNDDGAVELYYDNVKTFETKDIGAIVYNNTGSGNRVFDIKNPSNNYAFISLNDQNTTDNSKVRIGALANEMLLYSGAGEVLRLSDDGKVGFNNTDPSAAIEVTFDSGGSAPSSGTAPEGIAISYGTADNKNGGIWFSPGFGDDQGISGINGNRTSGYDTDLRFYTNGTSSARAFSERMRIDPNGKVGIGDDSPDTAYRCTIKEDTSGHGVLVLERTSNIDGTLRSMVSFERNGTAVGTILCSNSATQYNTSSDHRLKENVVTMSNATDRLKQLQPKRFNFILNPDITVDGFLAHEVQSVVPEAISGTKDEVDSDNNPVYQAIDHSKLVPLLTAALQEAVTKIEVLETRLNNAGIAT